MPHHFQPRPISTATNAYDLLKEIRQIILDEPKRYNQQAYLYTKVAPSSGGPACGTVGCRAGWVIALRAARPTRIHSKFGYAQKMLGISVAQAEKFFNMRAVDGTPQTPEHARDGARGITAFMREHRAQLKAKQL